MLSAFSGRIAALRVGMTRGWFAPSGIPTVEDVRDNVEAILDPTDTWTPQSMSDEVASLSG